MNPVGNSLRYSSQNPENRGVSRRPNPPSVDRRDADPFSRCFRFFLHRVSNAFMNLFGPCSIAVCTPKPSPKSRPPAPSDPSTRSRLSATSETSQAYASSIVTDSISSVFLSLAMCSYAPRRVICNANERTGPRYGMARSSSRGFQSFCHSPSQVHVHEQSRRRQDPHPRTRTRRVHLDASPTHRRAPFLYVRFSLAGMSSRPISDRTCFDPHSAPRATPLAPRPSPHPPDSR